MNDRESPKVLARGEWRTIGGIQRWVPAPVYVRPAPQRNPAELVACPFCRATIGETCRSRNGKRCEPHSTRIVLERRCKCGGRLSRRTRKPSLLCEACRAAARRTTWRLAKQRERALGRTESFQASGRCWVPLNGDMRSLCGLPVEVCAEHYEARKRAA